MHVCRRGEAYRIKTPLRQHLTVIGENLRDAKLPGDLLSASLGALAECGDFYSGSCPIGQYVSPAKTAADHPDLNSFALGRLRHFYVRCLTTCLTSKRH